MVNVYFSVWRMVFDFGEYYKEILILIMYYPD